MIFFHSWYTPKEHVFRDPNTFSNLHETFSSVFHFVLIQRWTALIQRKPALNSSETALISAGFPNPFWNSADQRWIFWNLWNSAVQRWFALELQPGILSESKLWALTSWKPENLWTMLIQLWSALKNKFLRAAKSALHFVGFKITFFSSF